MSTQLPVVGQEPTYQSGTAVRFTGERYDSIAAIAASQTTELFVVPIGQAGKTIIDTNMRTAAQIEKGNWLKTRRIGVRFVYTLGDSPATPEWFGAVIQFMASAVLSFKIDGVDHIGQWHLSKFLPVLAGAADAGVVSTPNMAPVFQDLGDNYIVLSENVGFRVLIQNGAVALPANTKLYVHLDGEEVRAQL